MLYEHATCDRDLAIAAALDALNEEASGKISAWSGTDLAHSGPRE